MSDTTPPQRFTRSLSGLGVVILTLSVLSPGVSIFVSGASIVQQAGTGAIMAFLLGSLVCYCQTAMSAELGAAYPTAGQDFASIGHALGDWAGATLYIASLFSIPLFLNTSAIGIATYLHPFGIPLSDNAVTFIVVALATVLSLLNIRTNEYVTGVFMAIETVALLLVAAIGAWHFHPHAMTQVLHPQRIVNGAWLAAGVGVVGIAINNASWALAGSNQALYFSEDMKNPKTIGRIIMLCFAVTVVLECAPVIGVIVGAKDLHAVLASPAVFETFLIQYLPPFALDLVSLAIALAIFNACLAGFVGIGRQVFSMARTQLFAAPVNRALMKLTPHSQAPWVAILAIGVSTAIVTFIPLYFKILLLSGGYTFLTGFYVLGVFRGRATGKTGHHDYRTPAFPLIPVLGVLVVIGEVVVLWLDADAGRKSLFITAGLDLAAFAYYKLVLARRPGGWTLTGPADIDAGLR